MRLFFFFFLFLSFMNAGYSQTGIGTTSPDPSAQLDVTSTEKGFLTPRMTKAQREGITDPATGLLVYQTDVVDSTGFYYFDGSEWIYLSPAADDVVDEFEGFSAYINSQTVSASQPLMNWEVTSPYYGSPGFDITTGIYTIPQTGKYRISATINYKTSTSNSVSMGGDVNPFFAIKNIFFPTDYLIFSNLPILDVNILLVLSLRTILGTGQVILTGDVTFTGGDQIRLNYHSDGMLIQLELGRVIWSVQKID